MSRVVVPLFDQNYEFHGSKIQVDSTRTTYGTTRVQYERDLHYLLVHLLFNLASSILELDLYRVRSAIDYYSRS